MPLEPLVNYIDDLNNSWPIGTIDTLAEADDHLRNIKAGVKGSFTNLGQTAVTLTAAQINQLLPDTIANALGINPVGAVIMFNAVFSSIPANWQLCDGTNGTPNMVDKFVYGTNTEAELLLTGGSADAVVVTHDHPFVGDQLPDHIHNDILTSNSGTSTQGYNRGANIGTRNSPATSAGLPTGTITATGVSGTDANIPPYVKLAYIQRMS